LLEKNGETAAKEQVNVYIHHSKGLELVDRHLTTHTTVYMQVLFANISFYIIIII